jgi:hypothetical protein
MSRAKTQIESPKKDYFVSVISGSSAFFCFRSSFTASLGLAPIYTKFCIDDDDDTGGIGFVH